MQTDNLTRDVEKLVRYNKEMFAFESIGIHNSLDSIRHQLNFDVPENWVEDEYVKSRVRYHLTKMIPQSKEELEQNLENSVGFYAGILSSPLIAKEIKEHYSDLFTAYDIRVNGILLNLKNVEMVHAYMKAKEERRLSNLSPQDRIATRLYRVSSYFRMEKFLEIADGLDDIEYWHGLKIAVSESDNTYRFRNKLKSLFTADRQYREYLMTGEERQYLSQLPELVKVYRAMTLEEYESKDYGVSWTLDIKIAEFFRDKYRRNHSTAHLQKCICTKDISKDHIIAYWHERREEEVIVVF